MKKFIALLVSIVMCLSLTSCLGPDRQPAIDAFNQTNTIFTEAAEMINANPEGYTQEVIDSFNAVAEDLADYKALLEGEEEVTEEDLATMITTLAEIEAWVTDVTAQLQRKQPTVDALNELINNFNEVATAINENIDDYTEEDIAEMTNIANALEAYGELFASGEDITDEELAEMDKIFEEANAWIVIAKSQLGL